MPDNDQAQSQTDTSATPTSGDSVGTTASANTDTQSRTEDGKFSSNYVYGAEDNVAEWKKFKTKEELDKLTDQMYNTLVQGGGVATDPATTLPAPVPVATVVPTAPATPDADAWLSDSAAAADAHFDARIANLQKEVLGPQLAGIYTANAQTARALALQANGDAFSKWGPEIDMQMQGIPVDKRSFEMYSEAVKLVKGNHAGEITREALDKAVQDEIERRTAAGTIRSGEAATSADASQVLDFSSENLGDRWKHIATDTTLEGQVDFLRKAYPDDTLAVAKQKYFKLLQKGDAVQAEANT